MSRIIFLLIVCITSSACAGAGFGSTFQIAINQPSYNYYQKLTATLTVPPLPFNPTRSWVFLWPGIRTSNGQGAAGLFQPVLTSSIYDTNNWRMIPWVVNLPGQTGTTGTQVPGILPGDTLLMTITYNGNNQGYTQVVSKNGQQIVTYSGGSGEGIGIAALFDAECNGNASGILPAHKYTNVALQLGVKDPNFVQHSAFTPNGVVPSKLYTNDGGLTWRYDTIQMQAKQCTPSS